ncbi:MAG TPA: hydantoinase B/oxoprolinase family protein [Polyangiaceae bacterium]|nr:hydantoinase B/oxoprolinase family protein [Polyangiaceae bacterium]
MPPSKTRGWQFWIDRGGTFTDIVARRPDGSCVTAKLLSEHREQYADAAVAGMRRLLGLSAGDPLPIEQIEVVKMGTTVGTNALLERKGERTLLLITRGFRDQLRIAYQTRPKLFAREIQLPELLYAKVVELDERVGADGAVVRALDEQQARHELQQAYAQGYRSVAIVLLHAWRYPEHERRVEALARELGFPQVSASHAVSPLLKVVQRGDTTVVDAYLSPVLRRYVQQVQHELEQEGRHAPLFFMKSNGGLSEASSFRGKDSILSGPAGGIVGLVHTCLQAGFQQVIGFDMGGTSTDVSHFAGQSLADSERQFETRVAGVRVAAPMMAIHTIAAGGGSILHFDGQRFQVGPDSAGASPGPACYRRGGPLTVTDCNVLLGKLHPDFFPRVFGPAAAAPIDRERVRELFAALAREVSRATGRETSPEQVAEGFLRIATLNMANAIKVISIQRGHDVTRYTLSSFGGAGGQHACLVADELGMQRVYIHPYAGVLSALGMGVADITAMRERTFERPLAPESSAAMERELELLAEAARAEVRAQGVPPERIHVVRRVHLKYAGTDTSLALPAGDLASLQRAFEAAYRTRFAFLMPERGLVIEALSVEAVGAMDTPDALAPPAAIAPGPPAAHTRLYAGGCWHDAPIFRREELAPRQVIEGPAVLAEQNATTVVEPGWRALVTAHHHLLLERLAPRASLTAPGAHADPVLLEVFNNLFLSIAEQMGQRLASTAYSVNIKERLDFSCAVFDASGALVANAPHMPVHLGSMGESIRVVLRANAGRMRPGDAYVLNDPYHGGTHLPDVTVVVPVFAESSAEDPRPDGEAALFYVAARGHHADIGGITPGSMPPMSRSVEEEGVLLDNFQLVEGGRLREAELRSLLASARYPARNPDQNLADLRAQLAACEKGREELLALVRQYGLATVRSYMDHVQDHAEECVRRAIAALRDGEFESRLDSGARIRVRVQVDHAARSARVDFTGTSAQLESNFNAPPAVVRAAVMYVFRTLVEEDIPMNEGCLRPIEIVIPEGSMLAPRPPAATVAGNVETSQALTDALYGALNVMAASQGTMNNFTFGDQRYQYYETIAGGSGAGPGFHGTAAVQTHMTNSRITDPEVLELRFPVRIEEHSIRAGSGGSGRFRGGDGALRRVRFLEPMTAAILADRRRVAPHGLAGGSPGECGQTWVERADGSREVLASCAQVEVQAGDAVVISTPSGGGYGAPV